MDVSATQTKEDTKRDKSGVTCFNCGKKGHFRRECRSAKKNWKPVPGKEIAVIDKDTRVMEVAAASYTQDDLEYDIERVEGNDDDSDSDDSVRQELRGIVMHETRETVRQAAQRWLDYQDDGSDSEPQSPVRLPTDDNPEQDPLETDELGEIAPPARAQQTAQLWGLSLTQDDNGQWRTRNAGEREGPNPTYLRKRVVELRTDNAEMDERIHELERHLEQQGRNQPFEGPTLKGWGLGPCGGPYPGNRVQRHVGVRAHEGKRATHAGRILAATPVHQHRQNDD
jgi:hypothetical protein